MWTTVRARKRAFRHAVRWGPVAFVVALFLLRLPFAAVAVILAWLGWVTVRSLQVEAILCPTCGKRLFRDGLYHNSFASRCLHCRQEIGGEVHVTIQDTR